MSRGRPASDLLLEWLRDVAAYGRPCPTNAEGAAHFGISLEAFTARIADLRRSGRVKIETRSVTGWASARRVTILEAGKAQGCATAWSATPARPVAVRKAKPVPEGPRVRDVSHIHAECPLPAWHELAARGDLVGQIYREAARIGERPSDFLVTLVAIGWDARRANLEKEAGHAV